ncbi:MAG: efflux RND transporter periplasmic adaptor subunit [Verrucomicrobiae bacterium]|nr:efflux RND transporter periplasmic adaptor subunit [Verrucomicrobiae bacterium]
MNKKIKIILFSSVALLVLGIALYPKIRRWLASENQTNSPAQGVRGGGAGRSALMVNATVLEPQTLNNMFHITGILLPDEEVDLTFESSGKITKIHFNEGSYVQKGDLLAKVNDAPLQAELKKLEAQMPLAEDRLYRQQTLLEKDAISQETYQSVSTQLETLKAEIELVKARIRQTELRAPFSGMIGLREVSEGAYASPTVVVARLTKISPLKIEFSLTQNFVNLIKPGTEITFTVENDLKAYDASVYAVESRLDVQTLSLFARARYANSDGKIKPGQSAKISIKLDQINDAIVIPSISSVKEMGRDITYIYENGMAKEVEIITGMRTSSSVEVISGLSVGDTLLTTGVMQLRSGMPVEINQMVTNSVEE